ncbi:MAG: hypothetical protein IJT41_02630 [Clostridia bacterium]|nr:hypothetical protein [Clostridia bacterium]
MKEQHATRVPTVLIGIGGIGGQIVRTVNRELKEFDKQFLQMVVLDTNTNDLSKSIECDIPHVQTSENMTVSDYLRQNIKFQEWFPMNPLINAKNLTQGAGQIRSVSRLGALASEGAHRFDTIRQAIEAVNTNVGNALNMNVRVMIVGSVCGGTGSGMGVQLPFLVRDLIEELAHMPRTIIRGLFIMPDIVEEVQDTDEKKNSVYVNGYAFLRELNGFLRAQTFSRGTEKLDIEHYHRDEDGFADDPTKMSHQIPYDFLFLVEKSNNAGQNIGGFDAYLSKAAQIVKAQLFASDMTANMFSSEDNLIVSAVNKNGLNRYCGAGISKAVYPEEENLRYCTLRFTESLLTGYWLRVDRMVKANMAQHRRQMATNPSLMPKDPQQEFIAVFDKLSDPTQSEVTAEIGMLKRELSYEAVLTDSKGQERVETVNHADNLLNSILATIDDRYDCDEMTASASGCKMSANKLTSNSAVSYAELQLQKMRMHEKKARERVGSLTAGIIDEIIGSDVEISQSYLDEKKYPHNICAAIRSKHPLVSRYMLYYVRKGLDTALDTCEAEIADLNEQATIFEKDYYKPKAKNGEKDTTKDDPAEALQQTKPGLLSVFGVHSGEYKRLVQTIVRDASAFVQRVEDLSKLSLRREVLRSVIKRMDVLIEIYEKFFTELEQILFQRKAEREVLEEQQPRIQSADLYVCADTDCKKWLYDRFEENLAGVDVSISDDVKKAFFDTVFKEYENLFRSIVTKTALTRKPISMTELFETAILKPMTDKYKDKEMQHIRMDIISAIKLEYNVHAQKDKLHVDGNHVSAADFDFDQYFAAISLQLKKLSAPYLSYSTFSETINRLLTPNADVSDIADETVPAEKPINGRVLCYWGINNAAAAHHQHKNDTEKVDRNMLMAMFGKPSGETYFVVNDDSFDPKELVCYSSVYDFTIENLDKYNSNSRAYKEYTSRILRVIKSDFNVGTGASAYLDTVHPHLDRHWHAHAYLPMLRIDDEMAERSRIARAFLLGIACSRTWYMTIDETPCWAFTQTRKRLPVALTINGDKARRSSYYTLFSALDENTVAVNDILRSVTKMEDLAYNDVRLSGVQVSDLLKQPVILGLIGDDYTADEKKDLEALYRKTLPTAGDTRKQPLNILEVLYSVYRDSYDLDLVTRLVDALIDYLRYYCLKMVNKQEGRAERCFKEIAKVIGANFHADNADMQFIMLCDAFLNA